MSDKKHIDRIFQEKLKDLEVTPSPKVWKGIQGELQKTPRENKKVFPIWLRIASVAAILLLLFTIGNSFFSDKKDTNAPNIVDTEKSIESSSSDLKNKNQNKTKLVIENKESIENKTSTSENKNPSLLNNKLEINTSSVANNSSKSETGKNNTKGVHPNSYSTNNSTNNTVASSKSIHKKENNTPLILVASEKVAVNHKSPATNSEHNKTTYKDPILVNKSNSKENKDVVSVPSYSSNSERVVVTNNASEKQNNASNTELDKNKADEILKNSTKDAVAENQNNTKENNTIDPEATKDATTSIEEEIAKAEDIIEKEEEKVNRWQVYANVAPVYYNSLGKGSHIDDQFVGNSKSGEINMSYGVNVSYAFNDKLKLRSGVHSLDLSYDTDNVILFENVGNNTSNYSQPRNLNLSSTGQSFSAISASNLGAQQLSSVVGENANAAISQRISYYEVPLEVEYNLVDNKFGVQVIGGVSTFILNDNKVYSEFEGYKTHVGEANNINNVSFSGNLGLGLDYKFSDKIKLNVQPTFKYQLNAYENTSGNFRPYIVGVYTGLSYKF